MNKFFGFLAGSMCGAVVGAAAALLLTPASGEELRDEANARWEDALNSAQMAREQTRQQLETQFDQMKEANT